MSIYVPQSTHTTEASTLNSILHFAYLKEELRNYCTLKSKTRTEDFTMKLLSQ